MNLMISRFALSALVIVAGVLPADVVNAENRPTLSFYGTPGLIDMPTATGQPDADLSLTTSFYGKTLRNTLTFQISERLSGSFRYSVLEDYFSPSGGGALYDRSFDVQYRLVDEGVYAPSVAVGLRDFGGTGIFGAEYFVATKHITPDILFTGGIGWGRLGSYGGFKNPLSVLNSDFETRGGFNDIEDTGRIATDTFFRGDAALFAGLEWRYSDQLSFKAEYSSDAYTQEEARMGFEHDSPFNFGLNYSFKNGVDLGAYYLYGSQVGVVFSYTLNPKNPRNPGGIEPAPAPVFPRGGLAAAASWADDWVETPDSVDQVRAAVALGLEEQGLAMAALELTKTSATVRLVNGTYDNAPQAIGRAARSMTQTLPPSVESITIVPVQNGVPISAITLQRSDLEELETALDGSWQSYARADIQDAANLPQPSADAFWEDAYPSFNYRLRSYLSPALFDPDNPVRADFGAEVSAAFMPTPGLVFSGSMRQPLLGNREDATRLSNSVLPHVRSDTVLYDTQSDLELSYLTAEYFFRPGPSLYGRLTAGYLEPMYGGLSGEILWKPVTGRLALGLELNYAQKRDFDQKFGFQDYDIVTGHASAYYDFGNSYLGQVDVGRYLAGDWGATFSLDREFANGFRIGAFFTLTDVSFEEFGEGSFDKGIRFSIPVSWLTGEPSQRGFGTTIRPVTRDGGARLSVNNRLYDVTRGYLDPMLQDRWGKFWR